MEGRSGGWGVVEGVFEGMSLRIGLPGRGFVGC